MAISINPYGTPKSLTNNVYEMLLKLIILNHGTFRPQWFVRMLDCSSVRAKGICCIKNIILLVQPKSHHLVIFTTFLRGSCCVKTRKSTVNMGGCSWIADVFVCCWIGKLEWSSCDNINYYLNCIYIFSYSNIISVIFYVGIRDKLHEA